MPAVRATGRGRAGSRRGTAIVLQRGMEPGVPARPAAAWRRSGAGCRAGQPCALGPAIGLSVA